LSNTKHKKEKLKLKLRLKLPRERENPGLLFSVVMNAACAFHAPTKYVEYSKQPWRVEGPGGIALLQQKESATNFHIINTEQRKLSWPIVYTVQKVLVIFFPLKF